MIRVPSKEPKPAKSPARQSSNGHAAHNGDDAHAAEQEDVAGDSADETEPTTPSQTLTSPRKILLRRPHRRTENAAAK